MYSAGSESEERPTKKSSSLKYAICIVQANASTSKEDEAPAASASLCSPPVTDAAAVGGEALEAAVSSSPEEVMLSGPSVLRMTLALHASHYDLFQQAVGFPHATRC